MMVKIINGRNKRYAQCPCGAELEYERQNIKRHQKIDHILDLKITTTYIICPLCRGEVHISQTATDCGNTY